jgi:hypothetical protein
VVGGDVSGGAFWENPRKNKASEVFYQLQPSGQRRGFEMVVVVYPNGLRR